MCVPPKAHRRALLTLLPGGHGLLALPEDAEEALGAVGVPAAEVADGPSGQAQPKVLVTEVPLGAGGVRGARAARCHLLGGDTHIRGPFPSLTPSSLTPGQARSSGMGQSLSVCPLRSRAGLAVGEWGGF